MAHNHRGQQISDPYLNARREMLAGLAYNPEDEGYDEAFGPADRVRRMPGRGGVNKGTATNARDFEAERMEDRRMEGY